MPNKSEKTHREVVPVHSKTAFRGNEGSNTAPGMWHRAAVGRSQKTLFPIVRVQQMQTSQRSRWTTDVNREVVTAYAVKECRGSRGIAPVIPNIGNSSMSVKRHSKSITSESEKET